MAAEKQYKLTDEHRAQLRPWADKWIKNALRTEPLNEYDKGILVESMTGLYKAANMAPPKEVLFVSSPFSMRFLAGFKAGILHLAQGKRSEDSVRYMERMKDFQEAYERTLMLDTQRRVPAEDIRRALQDGPPSLRNGASELTGPSADGSGFRTPDTLWYQYPGDMRRAALELFGKENQEFGIQCVKDSWRLVNGGNQWSGWVCYLSFFRHVVKLDLDYSKWDYYEKAAIHGGPRAMHPEFAIISDFPRKLTVDDQMRPHNEDGPFCEWSDGSALFAVHGVRVPRWIIQDRKRINLAKIKGESDAEIRRVMIELYGWGNYLKESGAKILDMDSLTLEGSAARCLMVDSFGDKVLIGTDGSTKRVYSMPVPREVETCKQAHEAIMGTTEDRLIAEC